MILVDTGFLVAMALRSDALHARAMAWGRHLSDALLVTEHVLIETINSLSRARDRSRSVIIQDWVLGGHGFEFLPASEAQFRAGVALYRARMDKEWSMTDCISFEIMRERGLCRALAYDAHFEQAGFEALLRRDP